MKKNPGFQEMEKEDKDKLFHDLINRYARTKIIYFIFNDVRTINIID